jgi:integrase
MVQMLTQKQIDGIKEVGRHACGGGLYLAISEAGGRAYLVRLTLPTGKRTWRTLGDASRMTLTVARREVALAAGRAEEAKSWRTFADAAADHLAGHKTVWRSPIHRHQWEQTLDDYVLPTLGAVRVDRVTVDHVASILEKLRDRPETLRRVRGRIGAVIDSEAARLRTPLVNPADARWLPPALKMLMRKTKGAGRVEHHEAPTLSELRAVWPKLKAAPAHRLLKWVMLTACRVTEARLATWDEIDLKAGTWTIPPERMKAEREHVVPLTSEALAVIGDKPGKGLLFPTRNGKPMSIDTPRIRLQRMIGRDVTAHGVRSTFRDWALDSGQDRQLAEIQLAHSLGDVEAAYLRSSGVSRRLKMMQAWASALCG